jgi:hypothetical protein
MGRPRILTRGGEPARSWALRTLRLEMDNLSHLRVGRRLWGAIRCIDVVLTREEGLDCAAHPNQFACCPDLDSGYHR